MTEYSQMSKKKKKNKLLTTWKRPSVGADLHHLDVDKTISTEPHENSRRRTLQLTKKDNSWGFTLQTYGIKHKKTSEIEIMTYVDYVEIDGASWMAGMRRGDVILSVNGERVGDVTHQQLVSKIRQAGDKLRLVVLFEDCCRKVDLHDRFLRLKMVLKSKYEELKQLELQEMSILDNYCQMKGLNRYEQMRHSIISRASTSSDSWDAYSLVSAPYTQHSTGHFNMNQSVSSLKSFNIEESESTMDDSYIDYMDSGSETDNISLPEERGMGRTRKSDSDLVTKYGHIDSLKAIHQHTSVSTGALNELKVKTKKSKGLTIEAVKRLANSKSVSDEVFVSPDTDSELKENGVHLEKRESFKKSYSREHQVFYAGENGKILVPKICIEGQEVYTTFDDIDTDPTGPAELPKDDPDTYQDKIVAMEIAKEMAKFKNCEGDLGIGKFNLSAGSKTLPEALVPDKGTEDFRERGASIDSKQSWMKKKEMELEGKVNKYGAVNRSLKLANHSMGYLGGSLSYDQLKSSVPDIRLPFHANQCQIIYINEKDESTKL